MPNSEVLFTTSEVKFHQFDSSVYIRVGYLGKVSQNGILFKKQYREKLVGIFVTGVMVLTILLLS